MNRILTHLGEVLSCPYSDMKEQAKPPPSEVLLSEVAFSFRRIQLQRFEFGTL